MGVVLALMLQLVKLFIIGFAMATEGSKGRCLLNLQISWFSKLLQSSSELVKKNYA